VTPSDDEKERLFREFLRRTQPYVAAIEAAGDDPWHGGDIDRRRALFYRRWHKPAAPNL
jgi:hypothetical protein